PNRRLDHKPRHRVRRGDVRQLRGRVDLQDPPSYKLSSTTTKRSISHQPNTPGAALVGQLFIVFQRKNWL
ncbi:MAG: hypothetical protein ACRDZ5_07515, partial [Acidimicrobiales bacterium]